MWAWLLPRGRHYHCLHCITHSLLPPSGQCGRLGFNISIISSTEFVVKAELRVRVNKPGHTTGHMKAVLFHANRTKIAETVVTSDWVEFSINNSVAIWARQASHIQHDFIVELKDSEKELGCTNILTESKDQDQQPLLVVYSIEPNYEDIPIIKGIRRMMSRQGQAKRQAVVQKRESMKELSSSCAKHTILIHKEWLNTNIVTEGTIIGPSKISADVCGGNCNRTVPVGPSHAIMFHLLATSNKGQPATLESPAQYSRCCVPLEYDHGSFIMKQTVEGKTVYSMWKLKNASVRKCGCIYYKKYQTAP